MTNENKNKSLEKNIFQNEICPHRVFMFDEDLLYSSNSKGEYKCKLQEFKEITDQHGSFNIDYKPCSYKNPRECAKYLSFNK